MTLSSISDAEIQREIGERLKRVRLNRDLSQSELADVSGLARKTITNAENGRGCSLATLIAMLRGLGELAQLNHFIPEAELSPIQLAKLKGKQRQRASGKRGRPQGASTWEWSE